MYATSSTPSDTGTTSTYNYTLVNMKPISVKQWNTFHVLRDICGGCQNTSRFMFDPDTNSSIKFQRKNYVSINPYGMVGGNTTEKWTFRAVKRGDYTLDFTYGAFDSAFTLYSVLVHVE